MNVTHEDPVILLKGFAVNVVLGTFDLHFKSVATKGPFFAFVPNPMAVDADDSVVVDVQAHNSTVERYFSSSSAINLLRVL